MLIDKHNKKMRQQEGSSGSTEVVTELDILLENIKEEADVACENHTKVSQEKQQQVLSENEKAEGISHGESL